MTSINFTSLGINSIICIIFAYSFFWIFVCFASPPPTTGGAFITPHFLTHFRHFEPFCFLKTRGQNLVWPFSRFGMVAVLLSSLRLLKWRYLVIVIVLIVLVHVTFFNTTAHPPFLDWRQQKFLGLLFPSLDLHRQTVSETFQLKNVKIVCEIWTFCDWALRQQLI